MMDSIARLVEEAERLGVDMAIEPVYWHPLKDLETTAMVFDKMNSSRLKMIFDPRTSGVSGNRPGRLLEAVAL